LFFNEEGLTWNQCFSLGTDGVPAMFGARQCFCARVKKVNLQVKIFHCLLHSENLASKRLSEESDIVMKRGHSSCEFYNIEVTQQQDF
jgi:hypothetical protein